LTAALALLHLRLGFYSLWTLRLGFWALSSIFPGGPRRLCKGFPWDKEIPTARMPTLSAAAIASFDFIQNEFMPEIEKRYRAAPYRIQTSDNCCNQAWVLKKS
jgi:hypothetical protein